MKTDHIMFQDLSYDDYIQQQVKWVEPMTAKEEDREAILEAMLTSDEVIAEEKLDGVRCTLHIGSTCSRAFSRRVSKKSNWFAENTDSLPELKKIAMPNYKGTILDGELRIPNQEFKEVSGMMNCKYDEAIRRQAELGHPVFHAFDIVWYKGKYVARLPLMRRKELLRKVIVAYFNKYVRKLKQQQCIEEVPYFDDTIKTWISTEDKLVNFLRYNAGSFSQVYPNLYKVLLDNPPIYDGDYYNLSKRAYFEYIVANGGEGIMLKPKDGKYYHKRGREYTKVKKFLTREVIVIGFNEPTKEYDGSELDKGNTWRYWIDKNDKRVEEPLTNLEASSRKLTPVTKHYFMKWIGTINFGVVVTEEEMKELTSSKKGKEFDFWLTNTSDGPLNLVSVGDTGGITEELRAEISSDPRAWKGKVIEVLANEIFSDTGKLRHPRYLRERPDKNPSQCTWKDHIGGV